MYISAFNAKPALSLNKKNEIKNHYLNYATTQNNTTHLQDSLDGIARINQLAVSTTSPSMRVSFTGNEDKKYNQFSYLTAENKSIGLNGIYAIGGEGVVVSEASENWAKQGADVRTFQPYHSADNEKGGLVVLKNKKSENGQPIFEQVKTDYKLNEGEKFVIIQEPNDGVYKYITLEDTDVNGTIKKLDKDLNLKEINYKLFKMADSGKNGKPTHYFIHVPDLAEYSIAYGIQSQYGKDRLSKIASANLQKGIHKQIAYDCDDYVYSQMNRAYVDLLPKLDTEKHGFYNPANHWLHDRQAFHALLDMSEQSANGNKYFNGLKMHSTFHNPGRAYQGHYENPIEFFRIVASEADYNALKENQADFEFLQRLSPKIKKEQLEYAAQVKADLEKGIKVTKETLSIKEILSKEELERACDILDPVIGKFKDSKGEYNVCKIAIKAVEKNQANCSAGTVSNYYGLEMKNPETPDIADGLTKDFSGINTHNIVNGSTPSNMRTNIVDDFGRDGCKLNTAEIKNSYTPYEAKLNEAGEITNIDEVFAAKKKNTEWIINTIANETKEGSESLNKLFFNEAQIKDKSVVLGGFSEYKEGDKLLIGWGRPDPQKGLPTTIDSLLHFFKRDDLSVAEKLKVKLILGAGGPGPWAESHPDWNDIKSSMAKIAELDGGIYKNNVCYVNGFFPNRLANAATGSIFTSVFEPCGITPLESYAAGNPVISVRTGGAPDFIKEVLSKEIVKLEQSGASKDEITKYLEARTGFLTKHAFLVKPEVIGKDAALADTVENRALTYARREVLAAETSDCIKDFVDIANDENKLKKMMNNVLLEKTDWHNNNKYNGGKSANQRYFDDVFALTEDLKKAKPRNEFPLKNLKGQFKKTASYLVQLAENAQQGVYESVERIAKTEKRSFLATKTGKIVAAATGVVAATGALAYFKNPKIKEKLTPKNTLAAAAQASIQSQAPTSVVTA